MLTELGKRLDLNTDLFNKELPSKEDFIKNKFNGPGSKAL